MRESRNRFVTASLAATVALVALSSCGGADRRGGDMPEAGAAPEPVIVAFFDAMAAADDERVHDLVAFPILWDSRCRAFPDHAALQERLEKDRSGDLEIHAEVVRRLDPAAPPEGDDEDSDHIRDGLAKLSATEGCGPAVDPLLVEGTTGDVRYYLVALHVAEEVVPTAVRVRHTDAGWRVTGLDN